MPQPRFDNLSNRLLSAGIAPRHVRRYVAELRDHFDDLMREELSKGNPSDIADVTARGRLGDENDLAAVALKRPELHSLTARYPWAVFGLGPVALLVAALASALLIEGGALELIARVHRSAGHQPPPEWLMSIAIAWNALPTLVAPLAIAGLLAWVGARQHISTRWILIGVVLTCLLGGFQQVTFTDNGVHGELSLVTGLLPPFPGNLLMRGIWRAAADLALFGGVWWVVSRRRTGAGSDAMKSHWKSGAVSPYRRTASGD